MAATRKFQNWISRNWRSKTWVLAFVGLVVIGGLLLARTSWRSHRMILGYPKKGPLSEAVYGLGIVVSAQVFELKSAVSAEIVKEFVSSGDSIHQGDPLLQLTDRGIVRAPFSGMVTYLASNPGGLVFPQVPILKMENPRDRYLQVALEQQGALRVRKGQQARLSFESLRGQYFLGTVRSIFPSDGQFLTRIDLKELPEEVLPGMTADVAIEVSQKESATLIPLSAIANGKVTVLRGGSRPEKIAVKVGMVDGQWAEILEPELNPAEPLVAQKR